MPPNMEIRAEGREILISSAASIKNLANFALEALEPHSLSGRLGILGGVVVARMVVKACDWLSENF